MTDDQRDILQGTVVTIRPGNEGDVPLLQAILAEPGVSRWWDNPEPEEYTRQKLLGGGDTVLLVIELDGEVAGGIQYQEEPNPRYRHASIDVYLRDHLQGHGLGSEAIRLVAGFLFTERGHHRLTIDPRADNTRAIAAYRKVGFRPVGIMRQYERGTDGGWHDILLMDLLEDELT